MRGPVGYRVLIVPDDAEESIICLPEWVKDRHRAMMTSGVVLEMGPQAGNHFQGERFEGSVLDVRVGDHVVFTEQAGALIMYPGHDKRYKGMKCRVVNDQDIYYNLTERTADEVDKLLAQVESGGLGATDNK